MAFSTASALRFETCSRRRVDAVEPRPEDRHRTAEGWSKPAATLEQGRLAQPVGHHRNELALAYEQRGVANGGVSLGRINRAS